VFQEHYVIGVVTVSMYGSQRSIFSQINSLHTQSADVCDAKD